MPFFNNPQSRRLKFWCAFVRRVNNFVESCGDFLDPAFHFDADPDPNFYFDADPEPDSDPSFQIKA